MFWRKLLDVGHFLCFMVGWVFIVGIDGQSWQYFSIKTLSQLRLRVNSVNIHTGRRGRRHLSVVDTYPWDLWTTSVTLAHPAVEIEVWGLHSVPQGTCAAWAHVSGVIYSLSSQIVFLGKQQD